MSAETHIAACQRCGQPFDAITVRILGVSITGTVCAGCDDEVQAEWQKHRATVEAMNPDRLIGRDEAFRKLAIEAGFGRYLAFDPERAVEGIDRLAGAVGVMLQGPTSKGKTFSAVEILRRHHAKGKSVAMVGSIDFSRAIGQPDSDKSDAMLARCVDAGCLLFDDLLKGAITLRVAEGLFQVAEKRENWSRPTIWTTNCDSRTLRDRLEQALPGSADPFLARIRRTTVTVILK